MNRRDCFRTLTAAAMALPGATAAGDSKGRFRSAICAYSFRDQLKAGSMTYADLIRMAADLGADGVDLTAYWLPDTSESKSKLNRDGTWLCWRASVSAGRGLC